jgi:hypothetical protein
VTSWIELIDCTTEEGCQQVIESTARDLQIVRDSEYETRSAAYMAAEYGTKLFAKIAEYEQMIIEIRRRNGNRKV